MNKSYRSIFSEPGSPFPKSRVAGARKGGGGLAGNQRRRQRRGDARRTELHAGNRGVRPGDARGRPYELPAKLDVQRHDCLRQLRQQLPRLHQFAVDLDLHGDRRRGQRRGVAVDFHLDGDQFLLHGDWQSVYGCEQPVDLHLHRHQFAIDRGEHGQ